MTPSKKYCFALLFNILFLTNLFYNCAGSTPQNNKNKVILQLPKQYKNNLISENLILSEIVVLETTDASLIKNINRLVLYKEKIIILNNKEEILFFNNDGNFLYKINKKGRGPGEYNHIIDISIDDNNDRIILYTDNLNLLIYNLKGEYISQITNIDKNNLYEKIIYQNNILFFYNPLNTNKQNLFATFDLKKSVYIKNQFTNKSVDFILRQKGLPIVKSKSIWYVIPLNNLLLNINDNYEYQINIDNFGISSNILNEQYKNPSKLLQEIKEKQICYGLSSIRETSHCIYFKSNLHDFIRIDKVTKNIQWCNYCTDLNNRIKNIQYFPHDAEDNKIMFFADENSFEDFDAITKISPNISIKKKSLNGKEEELNPILIFYKDKEL
jgi:hypothetical protein